MEILSRRVERLGFFRPIIRQTQTPDNDIELMRQRYQLQIPYESLYGMSRDEARALVTQGKSKEVLAQIFTRYKALERQCDFILCEGSDLEGLATSLEFDFNAEMATQIDAPVVVVANGYQKTREETLHLARLLKESFEEEGCQLLAIMLNRVPQDIIEDVKSDVLQQWKHDTPVYALPEEELLSKPTISRVAEVLNAKRLCGTHSNLNRLVRAFKVAATDLSNFLSRINDGSLVITPGDRADLIVGSLAAFQSSSLPKVAGLILTEGLEPAPVVRRLIEGFEDALPIYSVESGTYETATRVGDVVDTIAPGNRPKMAAALGLFEKHVDLQKLESQIEIASSGRVTPVMFQYDLIERAHAAKKRVVLPEAMDERILRATEILLRRNVVDITLLGQETGIRRLAEEIGVDLSGVEIVDPIASPWLDNYAWTYYELRGHKGITLEQARDNMLSVSYFGTMMVYKGAADAMVSGAIHTTGHTIRPALEFIKVHPSRKIVSSVFFMCMDDQVQVFGDCAVNPNPDSEQLADIAIASADTALSFGVEPRIAMLSYSSGSSGKGEDVDKVRAATEKVKQLRPDLMIEGPIQFDAAVDPAVGRQKCPDSDVAGRATVFIFPDLNTGNNTYKAVQRSANVIAMGPVLQGLRKPVNDLSRGCSVADIVNTVAITAIQAQT
jgi:phosphate acetyltransferase